MRKWSPEAFTAFETGPGPRFEPYSGTAGSAVSPDLRPGPAASPAEPDPLRTLREEYEARLAAQAAQHADELAAVEARYESSLERWAEAWDGLRRREAVRLADDRMSRRWIRVGGQCVLVGTGSINIP